MYRSMSTLQLSMSKSTLKYDQGLMSLILTLIRMLWVHKTLHRLQSNAVHFKESQSSYHGCRVQSGLLTFRFYIHGLDVCFVVLVPPPPPTTTDSLCSSPVAFYLHVLIPNDAYLLMNIPSPLFHCLSRSFFAWLPPQVTFIQYLSLFCISCAFAVLLFTLSVLCFLHPSISVWLLKALFKQASVSMTTT